MYRVLMSFVWMAGCFYCGLAAVGAMAQGMEPSAHPADPAGQREHAVQDEPLVFRAKTYEGAPSYRSRKLSVTSRHSGDPHRPAEVPSDVYVLLPSGVAYTIDSQPSLFWYLSQPTEHEVRITINMPNADQPLLSLTMDGSKLQGIQRLDLSRLSLTLSSGVEYEWVVTLVRSSDEPTKNIYAKSTIYRLKASKPLLRRISGKPRRLRAAIFAEEGIWVDSLTELCDLIDQQPENPSLRRDRAELLEQVDFAVKLNYRDTPPIGEQITLAQSEMPMLSQ